MNPDPRARSSMLEVGAALLALAWSAMRLGRGLGPEPLYNSDAAAPILLMQGLEKGLLALYYPGQDRYGMWPFLIGRWLQLETPESLHVLAALALCSAAVPLAAMLESPALAVLTVLAPVVLDRSVAWNFFGGQPYLWQVATLSWAWWACRAALVARTRPRRLLALGGFLVAALLSAWIATVSLAALAGVVVVEALRARSTKVHALPPVALLGLVAIAIGQLHRAYTEACKRAFGERFITTLRLDTGHLLSNLAAVLSGAWREGVVVPLLVGIAVLLAPRLTRTVRANQAVLVGLALCAAPALVLVQHFRENDFAGRYFAFPAYWAIAAAVHGAVVLAGALAGARMPLVRLGALGALVAVVPRGPAHPLAGPREEAARLTGAESRVLRGGYWQVYVPASLAWRGALLPIPREGEYDRFPALRAELRPGREVLAPCAMDGADATVEQYGALLRRSAAPPLSAEGGPWCLHRVERPARPLLRSPRRPWWSRTAPVTPTPPLRLRGGSGQSLPP
ncbi:MAG: hypothetical protein ACXWLI_06270 [Myxococcaceae bacterium]